MTSVFISYSRSDINFVQQLASDLQQAGLDVWWDLSDIRGSDIWEQKIQEGLQASNYFIIVLTPDSLASRWVRREYLSADSKGLTIIPIKLKEYEELPLTLRDIQPVDALRRTYEDSLSEILTILKAGTLHHEAPEAPLQPDIHNRSVPVNSHTETVKNVSGVNVAGTVSLILYLLLAGLYRFLPSGTFINIVWAVSALLSAWFLLSKRQIPAPAVFRYSAAIYVLGDSLNSYFFYDGNLIVLIVISAAALICAGILSITFQSPKKTRFYSATAFASFLILISIRTMLGLINIYPDLSLSLIVGVIASILLLMDL